MSTPLLILFALVFSVECRADVQISSDFYFAVEPGNYASPLLKEPMMGKDSFTVPSWNIGGEYQSSAEQVQMDFEYSLKLEATNDPTKYSYLLRMDKGSLHIGKIKTDAVIIKNMGGVHATIHLRGECRNLSITTQDAVELRGDVRLGIKNNVLGAYLQSLLAQNEQNWTMSVEGCDGPKGYQQALEEQLREFISNKQKMQDILLQPFQAQIDKKVASLYSQLFAEKHMEINADVNVSLVPGSLALDEVTGQLLLTGLVKTNIHSESAEQKYVEAPISKEEFAKLSQNGFVISQKYLSALVEAMHESRIFYKSYLAQQIPGLSSLLRSRLFQFFLWPDLLNFRKNAAFTFAVESKTKPEIQFSQFHKGAAWFNTSTNVVVQTKTPQDVGAKDYGQFYTPFRAQTWMTVYQGKLALGVYQPKINLKFRWDQLYVKLFSPFQMISAGFFGQQVQSSLNDFRWSSQLPAIEAEGRALLIPKALSGNADWLVLEYAP